ncbi:MAG: glycosyltransferase family 4 protein [Desulfobaccales bacterium]
MEAFGGIGGIAKYNRDFLRALCSTPKIEEVVAVPRLMPLVPEILPPKLTYIVAALPSRVSYIKAVLKLLIKRSKFDLIGCGHIKLLPVAILAKLVTKAPLLLIIYGVDAWTPLKNIFLKYFLSKVDKIISISEITKQRFMRWSQVTQEKFYILPNAIIQKNYGVGAKSMELVERYNLKDKTVLMTLGRLSAEEKYKGFDEIMELLPELAKQIPNIAYVIVGDGDDRPRLEAKAKSLGVGERIVFTGFTPEAEKADHYRLADAFVMPGRGEGFGFVFLEALACGIPAVGSTLDGSREALRGGALGILVDPRHPEDIQAGIFEALRRPRGVIPGGLEYFSFENFEKRCHQILAHVVKSREVS